MPTLIIGEFLRTLEDGDLNVRRVALVAFNSAAHNKPSLIRDRVGPNIRPIIRTTYNSYWKKRLSSFSYLRLKNVFLYFIYGPSVNRDLLRSVLPHLYKETEKRKDLIREVEMGPFKHEVDDGLDLRKAAFECMYTLLDTCVDRLDIFEFLSHVQVGYIISLPSRFFPAILSSLSYSLRQGWHQKTQPKKTKI